MALAMSPVMNTTHDDMDIDIDMDVEDTIPMAEDVIIEEGEQISQPQGFSDSSAIIPAIYTDDPALEPQWQKVHMEGIDDFKENDVRNYSKEHFPDGDPYVEWINDTSCNLVFKHKDVARQALLSFLRTPVDSATIVEAPLEMRSAKPYTERPASILIVRVAKAGDRKKRGAYLESRFYLMNPDLDPSARIERDGRPSRGGRGGSGDYRKRRYDDREDRKRRDHDHNADSDTFTASMYDDAPAPETRNTESRRGRDLFSRVSRSRRRSASPGAISLPSSDDEGRLTEKGSRHRNSYRKRESPPPYTRRDPHPYPKNNAGKELFSSDTSGNGLRSDAMDIVSSSSQQQQPRNQLDHAEQKQTNKAAANRLRADLMASAGQQSPRNGHRRSRAMDSRNEEDLIERFARKSLSQDSTKSINAKTANSGIELFPSNGSGFNIKGTANDGLSIKGGAGFSFKGRAGSEAVKELFPEQYKAGVGGSNRGKELFDEPVRQKNTRQRAGDLFD